MVRYRLDFIFAKIGFTSLQQLYRAKRAWTTLKINEEKRLRPFRIRIHDVKLFVRSPDAVFDENQDLCILPEPTSRKIGDMGANAYDARFRSGGYPDCMDSRSVLKIISCQSNSLTTDVYYLFPYN